MSQQAVQIAAKIGDSYDLLVAFARHLVNDKDWDASDVLYLLEKPWKWQAEYEQWLQAKGESRE